MMHHPMSKLLVSSVTLFICFIGQFIVVAYDVFPHAYEIPYTSADGSVRAVLSVPEYQICDVARSGDKLKCNDAGPLSERDGVGIGIIYKNAFQAVLKYCKDACRAELLTAFIKGSSLDFELRQTSFKKRLVFKEKGGESKYVISEKTISGCATDEAVEYEFSYTAVSKGSGRSSTREGTLTVWGNECSKGEVVLSTIYISSPKSGAIAITSEPEYKVNDESTIKTSKSGMAVVLQRDGTVKLVPMKDVLPRKLKKSKAVAVLKVEGSTQQPVLKMKRRFLSISVPGGTVELARRGTAVAASSERSVRSRSPSGHIAECMVEFASVANVQKVRTMEAGGQSRDESDTIVRGGVPVSNKFLPDEPTYEVLPSRTSLSDEDWFREFSKMDQKAFLSMTFPKCDLTSKSNERQNLLEKNVKEYSKGYTNSYSPDEYATHLVSAAYKAGIKVIVLNFDGTLVSGSFELGGSHSQVKDVRLTSHAQLLLKAIDAHSKSNPKIEVWIASYQHHPLDMKGGSKLSRRAMFAEPPVCKVVDGHNFVTSGISVRYHWPAVAVPWEEMEALARTNDQTGKVYRGPALIAHAFANSKLSLGITTPLKMIAYAPSENRSASSAMPVHLRNLGRTQSKVLTLMEIARREKVDFQDVLLIDSSSSDVEDAIMCGFVGIQARENAIMSGFAGNKDRNDRKGLHMDGLHFPCVPRVVYTRPIPSSRWKNIRANTIGKLACLFRR